MTAAPFTLLDVPRPFAHSSSWVAFTYRGFGTLRAFVHGSGLAYMLASDLCGLCGMKPRSYSGVRDTVGLTHLVSVSAPDSIDRARKQEAISEAGAMFMLASRARATSGASLDCFRWVADTVVPALRAADRHKSYQLGHEAATRTAGARQ